MSWPVAVRVVVGLAFAAALAVAAVVVPDAVASAAGQRAGDVVVINGSNGSELLVGGGGSTPFSLQLPESAACPGDSVSGNYRVQTFIVPATDDPAALTYGSQGPEGEGRWALYDVSTTPYVQVLTEEARAPGQPGRVTPLSQLSFAVFPPSTFPDGRYRMGVACTDWSETVRYWDTEIDVVADPDDQPARLRWAVVGAPAPSGVAGSSLLVGVTVVGILVAIAVLAVRRRAQQSPSPSPADPLTPQATPAPSQADHQEQP